jgi:DNA polymerase/3'-5' exonuclease PolX
VLDMLSIPGLKPEKINILHKELGIADLSALEAAAREDRLIYEHQNCRIWCEGLFDCR